MRVFLDDIRTPDWIGLDPDKWIVVKTAEEAISLLETGEVTAVHLDHDLGTEKTGYDVILWIEEKVFTDESFVLPLIYIHTANPSAGLKMEKARERIEEKYKEP